jgi:hypothetical protein|tara:strand:- start:144 stop:383 length:240 start_codon:yes stop_codon:yes gene_type:complete
MSDEENIEDIDEDMIDEVMNVISTDGYYQQAEIVKVTCPVCGEEFLGTKRHAGGFIAGHREYHEFINSQDIIIDNMGGI